MARFSLSIDYHDLNFDVEGLIVKGSPRTHDYPGDPDTIQIHSVKIGGNDISEHIGIEVLEQLTISCEEKLEL